MLSSWKNMKFDDLEGYVKRHDHYSINRTLIAYPEFLNARNEKGETLVHIAVISIDCNILSLLFDLGADINIVDNYGNTPLLTSCAIKADVCALLLLQFGANPCIINFLGKSCLHYSCQFGLEKVASFLFQNQDDQVLAFLTNLATPDGKNPLHFCGEGGSIQAARLIIPIIYNITALDKLGRTPLHYACQYEFIPLISLLLENGLSLSQQDYNGNTSLALVQSSNMIQKIKKLELEFSSFGGHSGVKIRNNNVPQEEDPNSWRKQDDCTSLPRSYKSSSMKSDKSTHMHLLSLDATAPERGQLMPIFRTTLSPEYLQNSPSSGFPVEDLKTSFYVLNSSNLLEKFFRSKCGMPESLACQCADRTMLWGITEPLQLWHMLRAGDAISKYHFSLDDVCSDSQYHSRIIAALQPLGDP